MSKIEKVKLIRALTVIGCTIAYCIFRAVERPFVGAILVFPFTCLSGVCAFMYYKLDKNEKEKVYKLSLIHLYTIVMYPYCLFACVLFINILCIVSSL